LDDKPTDLGSVFGAAMASQSANHYHGAREGFLKALRLEPKHAEARYRLAQMTLAIGAKAEAENHLRKLRQIVTPEDPRVRDIEQRLAARATSDKPASHMKWYWIGPRHMYDEVRENLRRVVLTAVRRPPDRLRIGA